MSGERYTGPEELPVVDGSLYGGAAYVAGYLATLALVVVFEGERFVGDVVEGAGWLYYNAQFVSIVQRSPPGVGNPGGIPTINYLTGQGLGEVAAATVVVPAAVYHAIPVVAFVVAGFLLARASGARGVATGAKVGASIAFGTVVFAFGGTFVFEVANAIGPNRVTGLVLAGLVYPVVCGAVGGTAAVLVDRSLSTADGSKPF